jgi:hypothetical protein
LVAILVGARSAGATAAFAAGPISDGGVDGLGHTAYNSGGFQDGDQSVASDDPIRTLAEIAEGKE